MAPNSRKLYIWLIGLGVVFAIYLLYGFISRTPPIDVDKEFSSELSREKMPEFGSERGMIGDTKVGTVTMARYRTADREFGFEKLLHQSDKRWEIEKPYMKVFRPRLRCDISGAAGIVEVEMVAGRPSPKDAKLSGDVIIHIFPIEATGMQEGFIYLDDLVFVSEKSEFSTQGPVRFVSQQAELVGRGLQLVYDEAADQLVILKIFDLDFLHLKDLPGDTFFAKDAVRETSASAISAASEYQGNVGSAKVPAASVSKGDRKAASSKGGPYYKCVLSKNVVIEYGQQLIFADEVTFNKLFWRNRASKPGGESTDKDAKISSVAVERKSNTGLVSQTGEMSGEVSVPDRPTPLPARQSEIQNPSDRYMDALVTCEDGLEITPMGAVSRTAAQRGLSTQKAEVLFVSDVYDQRVRDYKQTHNHPSSGEGTSGINILCAKRIDYDVSTGDTVATGPVDFTLVRGAYGKEQPDNNDMLPVRITAQGQAQFFAASNEMVFEGNVVGRTAEKRQGYEQANTVSGQKLIATLGTGEPDRGSAGRIKHARVTGGVVRLKVVRTSPEGFWSGTEMKCAQIDYDKPTEMVIATGPGIIKVDNSSAPVQESGSSTLGLKRPCYALVDNFEKLQWFIRTERIVAKAKSQGVHISYLPIEDTGYGKPVLMDAGHIDVRLSGTSSGQSEISKLYASEGIYYSEGRQYEFVGSNLFYDGKMSVMHVEGEPGRACLLNGVFVEDITYDLTTGNVEADIAGAGAMTMKGRK